MIDVYKDIAQAVRPCYWFLWIVIIAMNFSLVLCVLLGVTVAVNATPMFGDMMKAASDGMKQAMGAMGGGDNPFMKAIEDAKKMVEGGGGDSMKQMQAMLEKGLKEAADGDVQKQFQGAIEKMQEMMQGGSPHEDIMKALNQMQQG